MPEREWERRSLVFPKHLDNPDAEELLTFIQLKGYTDSFIKFGLTDDEQRCLETAIMINPVVAPVIEGTGGVREYRIRVEIPTENPRPKTSSEPAQANGPGFLHLSAYYAYFPETGTVVQIELFDTDEFDAAEITIEERAELKRVFEGLQQFGPEAWVG